MIIEASENDKITIMTGVSLKKVLGFIPIESTIVEKHARNREMDMWSEAVLKFAHPLIFFYPEFDVDSSYSNKKYDLSYECLKLKEFERWAQKGEIEFYEDIFRK